MSSESNPEPERDDDIPRQSFWSAVPKRTLSRVFLLLAMLAAILYLRARAGSIATCMSESFRAPAPSPPGVRVRGLAAPPPEGKRIP